MQSGKHRHGITPAWAGKSKLALCTPSCPTDHPRAGREKNKELEGVWLPMGSPPRRRGKERSTALVGTPTRITPAWAGKSFQRARKIKERGDHPRVGGEKSGNGGVRPMWQGSPPRGRGKAHVLRPRCLRPGITPAWAGKRSWAYINGILARDHPRVGGEKVHVYGIHGRLIGSPPRGRGKVLQNHHFRLQPGITPAWAGKRPCSSKRPTPSRDHPRVGGEKGYPCRKKSSGRGSPPRGRGKDPSRAERGRHWGITPAWAGKSFLIR